MENFNDPYAKSWFAISSNSINNKRNIFYHYSTLDALISIVENRQIHFSDYRFLNDASEFKYGKDLIKSVIDEKKTSIDSNNKKQMDNLVSLFNFICAITGSVSNPTINFYYFCLCEVEDLLSQWKGYPKDSSPLAIKFEIDFAETMNRKQGPFFFKVIYDKIKQKKIIEDAIDDYINTCRNGDNKMNIINFSYGLVFPILFFKDSSFSEENEWRFVHFNIPGQEEKKIVKFKNKKQYILPYIEYELEYLFPKSKNFSIKEILLGPSSNPLMEPSLKEFINSRFPDSIYNREIIIKNSNIPFRT